MRVHPVRNYNYQNNTNFQGTNKFCKYSIGTLIASTSLFMLSNAIDTYKNEGTAVKSYIDAFASILGVTGTYLGIFGLEKAKQHQGKK